MEIKPLNDRILVKPCEAEEKTAGGIVIPDSAKETQQKGKIVAIGGGKLLDSGKRIQACVAVGDTVVYGKYAGSEVKIDGKAHKIMRESEILAVLEE